MDWEVFPGCLKCGKVFGGLERGIWGGFLVWEGSFSSQCGRRLPYDGDGGCSAFSWFNLPPFEPKNPYFSAFFCLCYTMGKEEKNGTTSEGEPKKCEFTASGQIVLPYKCQEDTGNGLRVAHSCDSRCVGTQVDLSRHRNPQRKRHLLCRSIRTRQI